MDKVNLNQLIAEAKKRGYKKGIEIHYYPDKQNQTDKLEGEHFELRDGNLVAYSKAPKDRKTFEDRIFDTIYWGKTKEWVKIVDN
jgi:hypothetical protein